MEALMTCDREPGCEVETAGSVLVETLTLSQGSAITARSGVAIVGRDRALC